VGFMKYTTEMGSGTMIYLPGFIKIVLGIQKLIGWDSQTHRQHGDCISLLSYFHNSESRLKLYSFYIYEYSINISLFTLADVLWSTWNWEIV
jgi:hypothetical protein